MDALAAVRKFVFEEKSVAPAQLLRDMDEDFSEDAQLLHTLRTRAPKMGRDEECDELADWLLEAFAASLKGIRNERGGVFRAGTGSAMYYVWHADHLGATADGRRKGERLPANFSPSLMLSDAGPLSVIRAFARPALTDAINGGPLTLELHDTVFRNEEGSKKVAQLVRTFIQLGGHQLQLNAVDRDTLIDAQKAPGEAPPTHRARMGLERPLRAAGQDVSGSDHRPHVVQHLGIWGRGLVRAASLLYERRLAHGIAPVERPAGAGGKRCASTTATGARSPWRRPMAAMASTLR